MRATLYRSLKVKELKTAQQQTYDYYRPRLGGHCDGRMIPAETLDRLAERALLDIAGDREVTGTTVTAWS